MIDAPPPAHLVALAHPLLSLAIGLFFLVVGLTRRERGFLAMAGACIPFALGILIQISRPGWPSVAASALFTGLLFALAALSFYKTLLVTCRTREHWRLALLLTLLFLGSRYYYTLFQFDSVLRILGLQLYLAAILLLGCWHCRSLLIRGSGTERFLWLSVLGFALSGLPRTLLTLSPDPLRYGYDASMYWVTTLLSFNLFIVVFAMTLIVLNFNRDMQKVRRQAALDPLTGLSNRLDFETRARALRRQCDHYAMVIVDIDHFKQVNDRYGHETGDQVLVAIAGALAGGLRGDDLLSRYGGEEFLILLPATSVDQAVQMADRLRQRLTQATRKALPALPCTASFGVAEFSREVGLTAAYRCVDRLLYQAKAEGRNCLRHLPGRLTAATVDSATTHASAKSREPTCPTST